MRRVVAILATSVALLACGPVGPFPGGRLSGEPASPPERWALPDELMTVQLETRPDDPYSINIWIASLDGRLYVPSSLVFGPEDPRERRWVRNVLDDPRVRLRIEGTLYGLRAVRVSDPDELTAARARLLARYGEDEDEHARAGWIFRLDPR